jgi:predicted RNase H-like HicB family nuclease
VDLGPDTVACVSYTMNAGNPGASYLWSNGATNQFLGVGTSGTYWVQVTEPLGCIGSDTLNLTIAPNPVVNLGPDFTQCDSAVLDAGNPGSSFLWSGGQTTQLIPVYSTGAYGLTVTDGNGCSASDNINVTIGTTPSVDLGPDTAVCDTLFLLDAGNGPGSDFYSWSTGATTQSVLISASGTYWVAVSDTEGCTALDSISLTLNSGIVVDLGQDTAICSGTYLYSGIPGASYLWSTGETTISISISTSGYYFVTVTDTNGCQGFDDVNLTVIPGPVVDLGPDTAYCGGPVFLDAGPGMASYLWSDGTTTQLFEVPNSGTFYVDVIDMNGCPGEDMVDIDIYPVPVVDIGPDTVVCGPLILDAGNQPPGSAFVWNTAETTQAITVSASGTYSVAVINSFGCELSDTILITAGMAPVVDLGSDTAVCGNIVLDAGNPANSFLWSNGATTAQTQITTSGLVWVVVTDPAGCSASDSILVTVNPYPAVDLGPDRQACTSELLDAANPGSTYLWSTGSSSQTLSVSSSGIYWVEVTDPSGCAASDTVLITITGTPLVDLGPDTLVCGSYVLDAGNPGATFAWSTGATTQTITVSTTGFYFVTVTSLPACIGSDLVNVTVNPGPGPMVDLGPDTTVCNSYLLDAGNPGDSYLWSTGATTQTITITSSGIYSVLVTEASGCADFDEIALTIPANPVVDLGPDTAACDLILLDAGNPGDTYVWSTGATTQTIMVSQSGVYFVTVANPEGCIGSDLINVTVSASPQADLGPDTVSCNPVLLDAANPGLTYLWSNGAGTQSISATLSGTYWVNVTNAAGCISSDTVQVTIDKPIVNLGPDTTVCDNIVLDAGNPGSIFAWSTSATTQTITASSSGFYFVTVTGATGCISSDLVNITVLTGPPPVVDLGPDTSACEAIWLDAGNPGSTYSWTNGATTQTLMVPISGTYGVTVTGPGGCTAYDEAVIQIYNSPVVDLGPDAVKCNNLILDAGNPGAGFLWNTGATTQTISVSASGEYSVQVTTPDGCAAADTIQVSCCGKDSFEPNNVMADAANLYGGALAGWSEMRICPQGDVDFFEVKLNVAGTIRVTLGNPFFNADVELLNAGGILASSSNSGTATDVINYPNAPAGTYYVRVFGAAGAWSENSTYKLVVSTLLPAPSGGIIKNIPKDPIFRTLAPDLKVYPNPTAGPLTLEFSNGRGDPAELSLYDVSGRRLLTEKHETGRGLSVIRLDPGQIPEGVYFLEVRMDGYFWREKLIVSKR